MTKLSKKLRIIGVRINRARPVLLSDRFLKSLHTKPKLKAKIITVRKRSCGKVMFLHLSVSHSVHGGCISQHALGQTPPPQCMLIHTHPWQVHAGIHTPCPVHARKHPPPGGDCCGRYASYWNVFLSFDIFCFHTA